MPLDLKTPGVYIYEKNSGRNSVVQVPTAVPVFIGYTEKASINGKSFHMKPVQISSLSNFEMFFGGAPKPIFTVKKVDTNNQNNENCININGVYYVLEQSENSQFYLYNSLKLFFDNGGSDCYIISIGQYGNNNNKETASDKDTDSHANNLEINADQFKKAIDLLEGEAIPTMLLMPDSLLLNEEDSSYYTVQTYALRHCAEHMNKIALFDIYGANTEQPLGTDKNKYITRFRENIGLDYLSYGACYYPWVKTNIITMNDINYSFFNLESLKDVIKETHLSILNNIINSKDDKEKEYWDKGLNSSLEYKLLKKTIADKLSILPVSPAIAGLYTRTDKNRGVWIAPANSNLNSVIAPSIKITHKEQENLNVDAISGKSINAIRTFPGRGSAIVWGERTLSGNDKDWRYISVRRLFILIEQSIKNAALSVVFEPNVPITWARVKANINNFLAKLYSQGAFAGNSQTDAFSVSCGLGETMDQNDVDDGIMKIQVEVAPVKPAEFIVISFEQKIGKAA